MDWKSLIPVPDTIPAHWIIFESLDILTFMIHILIINVALGGSLIILFSRFKKQDLPLDTSIGGSLVMKIPSTFALGVTFGIAPLLFVQVLYGNLIYSSSILMGVFWLLIIPFIIIAY